MNFTQQQLESMSDLELNIVAANHFYDCDNITVAQSAGDSVEVICNGIAVDYEYNPCGDWLDCSDIMEELDSMQSAEFNNYYGMSSYTDDSFSFVSESINSRRTVIVIYILVKQGRSNDN